ncbi:MAG: ankyrin repeat domain-containing protein [Epsilonproteobacteria bacterium]|nr:ankyrin repeat domain-containing protein [Campylobacterota bacterium]
MKKIIALSSLFFIVTVVCAQEQYNDWFKAVNAIYAGDFNQVIAMSDKQDFDINQKGPSGQTLLHEMAERGSKEQVNFLIDRGADVNARDDEGKTILHVVSRADVAQLLFNQGAVLNDERGNPILDVRGQNPLHEIVAKRDELGPADKVIVDGESLSLIELMLKKGADPTLVSNVRQTPLHMVRDLETAKILIESGGKRILDGDLQGRFGPALPLLPEIALHAVDSRGSDVIRMLVTDYRLDVNQRDWAGQTVLHTLARTAHVLGDDDIIKFLLDNGGQDSLNLVTSLGQTPLMEAVGGGNNKGMRFLVEQGADVTVKDFTEKNLLHVAAGSGFLPDDMKFLIDKGLDINAVDVDGNTPLHYSVALGEIDGVKFLIDEGADLNVKDKNGMTLLHKAPSFGMFDDEGNQKQSVLEFLFTKGLDVNAVDSLGNTPLHYRAMSADVQGLKMLVDQGADVTLRNKEGQSILDIVRDRSVRFDRDNAAIKKELGDNYDEKMYANPFKQIIEELERVAGKQYGQEDMYRKGVKTTEVLDRERKVKSKTDSRVKTTDDVGKILTNDRVSSYKKTITDKRKQKVQPGFVEIKGQEKSKGVRDLDVPKTSVPVQPKSEKSLRQTVPKISLPDKKQPKSVPDDISRAARLAATAA